MVAVVLDPVMEPADKFSALLEVDPTPIFTFVCPVVPLVIEEDAFVILNVVSFEALPILRWWFHRHLPLL